MSRAMVCVLVLLGFGLRAWRLDGQSLWYDEGISVALAGRDLLTIARSAAADIHPPLYYYLLHFWTPLAGVTEFAVRWPSALCGTALVPLVYALGRRLRGAATGLLAGLFVAVNPLLVYYSQEARMYVLVTALGALAAYLALRLTCDARTRRWLWAGYVSAAILTAYSHYYGLTVLLALNLYAIPVLVLSRRRRLVSWLLANAAVGFAFLPWLGVSWEQLRGWPAISQPLTAADLAGKVFGAFSFGLAPPAEPWPGLALLLLLAGLIPAVLSRREPLDGAEPAMVATGSNPRPHRSTAFRTASSPLPEGIVGRGLVPRPTVWNRLGSPNTRHASRAQARAQAKARGHNQVDLPGNPARLMFPVLWAGLPVLVLYIGSLQRPMYNPKFLLVAVPAYLLLLAIGAQAWIAVVAVVATRVGRTFGHCRAAATEVATTVGAVPVVTTAVVTVLLVAIVVAVTLPAASALLAQQSDPRLARDDYRGIVRHIGAAWRDGDAVLLNAPGQVEIFAYYHPDLQDVYPQPQRRPPDETETTAALREMSGRYRRIWAVLWAAQQADPQGIVERWLDANAYKSLSRWYGGVRLALYTLPGAAPATLRPLDQPLGEGVTLTGWSLEGENVQPGEVVGVSLYWRADRPLAQRYKVFVQLLDPQEFLWGQHDSEPAGGSRPTVSWKPGEPVTDRHGLAVPLGTPPGRYDLIAGMYDPNTGRRLEVAADPARNRVLLGSIVVERPPVPPPVDSLGVQHPLDLSLGPDLKLEGYDAFRYGSENPDLRAGESILLNLYWQARRAPAIDYDLEMVLKDSGGQAFTPWRGQPVHGNYPTSRWREAELVRDQYRVEVNAPGEYTIGIVLRQGDATVGTAEIGKLVVR